MHQPVLPARSINPFKIPLTGEESFSKTLNSFSVINYITIPSFTYLVSSLKVSFFPHPYRTCGRSKSGPCALRTLYPCGWTVNWNWNAQCHIYLLKFFLNIQDSSSWSVFQPDIIISASEGTLLNNAQIKSKLCCDWE